MGKQDSVSAASDGRVRSWTRKLLGCGVLGLCGCTSVGPTPQATMVGPQVEQRMGYPLCDSCPRDTFLPPGVVIEDGLTEDEAIRVALCNNALFQELLVDLQLANSDLIQAGLLPNPEAVYFFPVSEKPYKYLVDFPIEALWLRPIRVGAAKAELGRQGDRLTQVALDLIRDTRVAYADALLAQSRQAIGNEAIQLRGRIAAIAEARLEAGDLSQLEVVTARTDALQATQDMARLINDREVSFERLRWVLGIGDLRVPLSLAAPTDGPSTGLDVEQLVAEAVATRPDVYAANQAVAAAQDRLRLARLGWVRVLGIADATSGTQSGHALGPALRFTLPIFNWNQGLIARAEGELERAIRQQQTLHNQIVLDVRQAHIRYEQTWAELSLLRNRVRPEVDAAIRRSQVAYQEGNTTYLIVLEATRQLLDSFVREAQLTTDLQRAAAELERSTGRRLPRPEAIPAPPTPQSIEQAVPAP